MTIAESWRARIVEFLLARIADDKAVARCAVDGTWMAETGTHVMASIQTHDGDEWIGDIDHDPTAMHILRHQPARVLAECAAKRAIIELVTGQLSNVEDAAIDGGMDLNPPHVSRDILRTLAVVYADHPDYDQAWAL